MPPDRGSLPRFVVEVVDVNGAWASVEQVRGGERRRESKERTVVHRTMGIKIRLMLFPLFPPSHSTGTLFVLLPAPRGAPGQHPGHARRPGASADRVREGNREERVFCFPSPSTSTSTNSSREKKKKTRNLREKTASSPRPTRGSPASASTPPRPRPGSAIPWRRSLSSGGTTPTTGSAGGAESAAAAETATTMISLPLLVLRLCLLPPPLRAALRQEQSPSEQLIPWPAQETGAFCTCPPTGANKGRAGAATGREEARRRRQREKVLLPLLLPQTLPPPQRPLLLWIPSPPARPRCACSPL